MLCAIWYHLSNLKNVKNSHGGVLSPETCKPATLLNLILLHGCSSRFVNCTNVTKSGKVSHVILPPQVYLAYLDHIFFCYTPSGHPGIEKRRKILEKKCSYLKFFWSVFSGSLTEYGDLLSKYSYSVRMPENRNQKNTEYGHF